MKIWIDLENAPNVLFFAPIIRGLQAAGYEVLVTARDYAQTLQMAAMKGVTVHAVGKHYETSNKFVKAYLVLLRTYELRKFILGQGNVKLGIGHSSRSLSLVSKILRIASINMLDYESGSINIFNLSNLVFVPSAISIDRLVNQGLKREKIITYEGLKEEQYIGDFTPDARFLTSLSIDSKKILIVLRPPATFAHYHNPQTDRLFFSLLGYLGTNAGVVLLIPFRYKKQETEIRSFVSSQMFHADFRLIDLPLDGLNLVWNADVVISGGGTMAREAALLLTPAYSIFRGLLPSVEQDLVRSGKIKRIESESDFHLIEMKKKEPPNRLPQSRKSVLEMLLRYCELLSKGKTLHGPI